MPPKDSPNGNKYAQIAALWGVDVTDSSIQLLQEFDRRFEELKEETKELKRQNEQWTGITSQLLGLVRDQNTEAKTLSKNTETLSTSSSTLSQELQSLKNQIKSQQETSQQLQSGISTFNQANPKVLATMIESEERLNRKIEGLSVKTGIQWTPLFLAVAIGGLCWFFGSKQGFDAGQLEVAKNWFGGIENLDYWRQVRNLNKERADQCRQQGQSECPVRLP